MQIRTIALLSLTVLFGLELSGREPIKSPPPVKQLADIKVVRARDLGVPFDGTPGKLNSITDVPGVEVGYTTLSVAKENWKLARARCAPALPQSFRVDTILSTTRFTPAISA